MKAISCAFKIEEEIKSDLKIFCASHGLKQSFFVEQAIREKIEREEDLEDRMDFIKYRNEKTDAIDFSEYLAKRKKK